MVLPKASYRNEVLSSHVVGCRTTDTKKGQRLYILQLSFDLGEDLQSLDFPVYDPFEIINDGTEVTFNAAERLDQRLSAMRRVTTQSVRPPPSRLFQLSLS